MLKYFLSETIHNGGRGTHFAKFLISNFLKGLSYSTMNNNKDCRVGQLTTKMCLFQDAVPALLIAEGKRIKYNTLKICWEKESKQQNVRKYAKEESTTFSTLYMPWC